MSKYLKFNIKDFIDTIRQTKSYDTVCEYSKLLTVHNHNETSEVVKMKHGIQASYGSFGFLIWEHKAIKLPINLMDFYNISATLEERKILLAIIYQASKNTEFEVYFFGRYYDDEFRCFRSLEGIELERYCILLTKIASEVSNMLDSWNCK